MRDTCNHKCDICDDYIKYHRFFIEDCLETVCKNSILQNKGIHLIEQYPCFPGGSFGFNYKEFTLDNLWVLHKKLVNEYNEFVYYYSLRDPDCKDYKYIQVIPKKVDEI